MSETPRTNTAAYNGHKYLRDECAALEIENRKLRTAIKSVLTKNAHLADGEVCTLRELKQLTPEWDAEFLANTQAEPHGQNLPQT